MVHRRSVRRHCLRLPPHTPPSLETQVEARLLGRRNYQPKHTGAGSIDVRKAYSVRSWPGTDLVRLGCSSHDKMFDPTTWTDCEGGVKTAVN